MRVDSAKVRSGNLIRFGERTRTALITSLPEALASAAAAVVSAVQNQSPIWGSGFAVCRMLWYDRDDVKIRRRQSYRKMMLSGLDEDGVGEIMLDEERVGEMMLSRLDENRVGEMILLRSDEDASSQNDVKAR